MLGDPVTNCGTDLVNCHGVMQINHEQVGEGYGRDVMGHPFEPLVWLANELSRLNHPLKAGDTVITGSLVPPTPLSSPPRAACDRRPGQAVVVCA